MDMSWLQQMMGQGGSMGMQGGGQMTPGSGMPPYRNAPMNMQTPQMGPPTSIPGAPPVQQPQQSPINPAQMGMLSQMLAQNTRRPPTPGVPPGAMTGNPATGQPGPGGMDPTQMGILSQMLGLAKGPFG